MDSIINQTLKDIEIICINDGSTDNSGNILEKYKKLDNRIKIFHQENIGVGETRNKGIRLATGEFLAFMDPDDFYPTRDILETMYNKAIKTNSKIIGGEFAVFYNNLFSKSYTGNLKKYLFNKEGIVTYKDFQFDYGWIRFIYNTQLLKNNNITFPNYKRFQDPPFFVKVMSIAKEFYAIKKTCYAYRITPKSQNFWDSERVNGLLCGLKDNLILARKYNYKKLLRLTTNRLIYEYKNQIKQGLSFRNRMLLFENYLLASKSVLFKHPLQKIFSIINYGNHKRLTILGIKINFKRNNTKLEPKKIYNIGIVGCGVIGGALIDWIEQNNPQCHILKCDPPKGLNDNLDNADVIFVSIHIPTEKDGTQDLTILERIIQNAPNVPIYIRTTLLPGTCDYLSKKSCKQVHFMPEFLTERTAVEDFRKQPMIFTGDIDLLEQIFIGKKYRIMTSLEAEITKYTHNVFGALKVTYFNGIYNYCKKLGASYNHIRNGVLLSGYINEPHTQVPGPDGKLGYGGKCFPKDVNAFLKITEGEPIHKILQQLPEMNEEFRNNRSKEEREMINAES